MLSVLLALALGALAWPRSAADDAAVTSTSRWRTTTTTRAGGSPPSGVPPSVVPPSTAAPAGPPPSAAEAQAVVDELVGFVQQHRGLTFTSPPPVEVLDAGAFDEQVRAELDRHAELWQRRALTLQLLGVVEARIDVVATLRALAPVGQVARYDPASRTIAVRAEPITAYTRRQLTAALTAALDDQRFGIDRPGYDASPDEIRWAFDALRIGDATRLSRAWEATLAPADAAEVRLAERDALAGVDLDRLPPALAEIVRFPTGAGAAFATALAGAGNGPLDAAFAEPPRTTAEILHPERHLGRVPAVAVPPPEVSGRVHHTGAFGELLTVATLADTLPADAAASAAAAWAGDSHVIYEGEDGALCIRIAYRASSPEGLGQLNDAFVVWAERHEGTEVALDGDTLLVDRCLAGGGRSVA